MKNDNKQGEKFKEEPAIKRRGRKTTQATVLKQLNSQSLYPLRERVGIYVIAILSTIGLILITYTGVMAIVGTATNGNGVSAEIDLDLDDVADMLEDLELLETTEPPTEAPTEPPTEAPTEPPTEAPTEPPTEPPTEAPTEPEDEAAVGLINTNMVRFWRNPDDDPIFQLDTGDEVNIYDLEYNADWARVGAYSDVLTGELEYWIGFVRREFIDVD